AAPPPGWGQPAPAPAAEARPAPSPPTPTSSPPAADWGPEPVRLQEPAPRPAAVSGGSPTDPATSAGVPRDPELVPANAPRVLAAFLVSYETSELGTFWPIYQGVNALGRKDAADGLTIEIEHPTTSSRHASILASARPGRVKVEDLGSTNGTFVDDERIPPGTKRELRDGQVVRFGGYSVTVKIV
ncbi:MAG TPA: FHA domain-containing protein, partial [Polyangiaceae bacterium]|nr:FHA domain-containing protein [Polyangiaceae bacterium]